MQRPPQRPTLRTGTRIAFVLYTITLTTATHWPGVTIEGPVPRPDLWVHLGAYSVWCGLLVLTGWVRASNAITTGTIAAALGAAWGGLDELTQPIFERQASWSDWAGDVAGCVLGALLGVPVAARLFPPSFPAAGSPGE